MFFRFEMVGLFNTFNISTLSCFIVAGAGQKVAKHGNYGASSISGSSNVMEQLGYSFKSVNDKLKNELDKANICFLHAPLFHPALKTVGPIRKNLGVRTFFNMLGPMVNPAMPDFQLVATLVRFPTWDKLNKTNRSIPAFVYRPRTPGPHPVLIDIHGGPESQHRPVFNAFTQYLVNELGYVVIAPNVRGSSGYGKSYLKLDNGKLREDAVRDIGALLVWIGLQGDLDAKRVVVSGGSYGGYMTLASVVSYSDRLRGGIDTVGISNFVTFLEKTSAYRRDLRRAEYGDERIRDMRVYLTRISPLTNAASIRVPLLVVQGLNDPRVPASESEQMVARIRSNGGEVWYLAARDEGHGFRKKANRDFNAYVVASFLKRLGK